MTQFGFTLQIGQTVRKATRAEFEVWLWYTNARDYARRHKRSFIMPRAKTIGGILGYCKDTVLRALKALDLANRISRHAQWRTSQRTAKQYRRPNKLTAAAKCFSGWLGNAIKKALSNTADFSQEKSSTCNKTDDIFVAVSSTKRVALPAPSEASTTSKPYIPGENHQADRLMFAKVIANPASRWRAKPFEDWLQHAKHVDGIT